MRRGYKRIMVGASRGVLFALAAALPLSFLHSEPAGGLGATFERFPRGWQFRLDPGVSYMGYGYTAGIGNGIFIAAFDRPAPNPKPVRPPPYEMDQRDSDTSRLFGWPRIGLAGGTVLTGDVYSTDWTAGTGVVLPFWPLSLAAMGWLAVLLFRWKRQRHRAANGACQACGYDLRAHKPGEKCPECGTISAPSSR